MSSVKSCLAVVVFAVILQCSASSPQFEATALDYMTEVGTNIADTEGIPKDLDTAPTTVWCFADKGKHFVLIVKQHACNNIISAVTVYTYRYTRHCSMIFIGLLSL